jgi:cystathionine beta-lyase family protein involved in aluminum resistance
MAVIQSGGSVAGVADVDANYNLKVTLPDVNTQAGYALVQYENMVDHYFE